MRAGYIDANSETYNCTKWKLNYTGAWAALSTSDIVSSSAYSNSAIGLNFPLHIVQSVFITSSVLPLVTAVVEMTSGGNNYH